MLRRLLGFVLVVSAAQAATAVQPSGFYVVSAFFSDNGALFYYRVVDVRQEGADTSVRYLRVAPASLWCPKNQIVQEVEARVPNTSPTRLLGNINPCEVRPADLQAVIKHNRRNAGILEAISFGIVAQCGSGSLSLALPDIQMLKWDRVQHAHPEMARLWDLASEVTKRVFGENDIFHNRSEEEDLALQQRGQTIIPELLAGIFDAGLAAAARENVGHWKHATFRELLIGYSGPIRGAEADTVPTLLNADQYHFVHYVPPKYMPLALQARVKGKVELQLGVNKSSGEIRRVTVLSGHPLLTSPSLAAARQWRFAPDSVPSETFNVTLDFSLRCPPAPDR